MTETKIPEEYIAERVGVLLVTGDKKGHTKGETIIYYENVPFFVNVVLNAFGVLHEGAITFYPLARLYSLTLRGKAMEKFIAQATATTAAIEQQLAALAAARAVQGRDAQ